MSDNPYAQFVENPYDRFVGGESAPARKKPTMSATERFLLSLQEPDDGAMQLAAKANAWMADKGVPLVRRLPGDPTKAIRERKQRLDESAPEGIDWARIGGNMASPANIPLMLVPGGGVVRAAALGAGSGVMSPAEEGEDFWSEKGKQAGLGAVAGGGMTAGARALGRVISPNAAQNPQLQMLRREGVNPTVGQALGGRWNVQEERLADLPFLGDAVALARGRAQRQWREATMNQVTRPLPGSPRVTREGREGIAQSGNAIGRVYDQAAGMVDPVRPDLRTLRDVQSVVRRVQGELPQREQDTLRALLNRTGSDVTPQGSITNFKRIDSTLGDRAAHFGGATDGYQRDLGTAIGDIRDAVRQGVMRKRPQAGVLNTMADDAYGRQVLVENAANRSAVGEGRFTPGELLQSIRQGDPRVRHRGFARGEGRMQDWAEAGQGVLGNKVPNSGTAGRAATTLGVGLLGGAAIDPTIATATVAGMAAYTPLVQRLLVEAVAGGGRGPRAAAARRELARIAPHLAVPGGKLGSGLFDQEE